MLDPSSRPGLTRRPQVPRRRHAAPRPSFALARLVWAELRDQSPLFGTASFAAMGTAALAGCIVLGYQRFEPVGQRIGSAGPGADGREAPDVALARQAGHGSGDAAAAPSAGPARPRPDDAAIGTAAPPTTLLPPDGLTAAQRQLSVVTTQVSATLSPKSVVTNGHGLFFAQNMMYRHTVSVFDRAASVVATIPDSIRLADFGFNEYPPGTVTGSPVEAVSTADGRYVYVSNYQMDGPGFANPGNDTCGPGGWDPSFVYRIDTARLVIDQVIRVGSVPKFLALSPDEHQLLVANWCSYDLSVVDLTSGAEARRVPLGPYPRGIVTDARRGVAYVAVMGSTSIAVVDLRTYAVSWLSNVGLSPRHLVLDGAGQLYATLNGEGRVVKVDPGTGSVVAAVRTGDAPRSMAISDDGTALYVVNYESNSLSKVRTADMVVTQTVPMFDQPIGVAYDAATRTVWVSVYAGGIVVLADTRPS